MSPLPRLALIFTAALALSACGGSGDSATEGKAENSRILEGSVSDEMIAYDKLKSEPPAAKIEEADTKGGKPGGSGGSPAAGSPANPAPVAEDAATAPEPEAAASPAT